MWFISAAHKHCRICLAAERMFSLGVGYLVRFNAVSGGCGLAVYWSFHIFVFLVDKARPLITDGEDHPPMKAFNLVRMTISSESFTPSNRVDLFAAADLVGSTDISSGSATRVVRHIPRSLSATFIEVIWAGRETPGRLLERETFFFTHNCMIFNENSGFYKRKFHSNREIYFSLIHYSFIQIAWSPFCECVIDVC